MTRPFKSIAEMRTSLNEDVRMKFIPLLEKHHQHLKSAIAVLTDSRAGAADKREALIHFVTVVFMHGRAEEETLYLKLIDADKKEARLEGYGGKDEHEVAFQMIDELEDMNYNRLWTEEIDAKAKVLATLVSHHVKEEESVMFAMAKKDIGADELNRCVPEYLAKCRAYLEEETGGSTQRSPYFPPSLSES